MSTIISIRLDKSIATPATKSLTVDRKMDLHAIRKRKRNNVTDFLAKRQLLSAQRVCCQYRGGTKTNQCNAPATMYSRSSNFYCFKHYRKIYGGKSVTAGEARSIVRERLLVTHMACVRSLADARNRCGVMGTFSIANVHRMASPKLETGTMNVLLCESWANKGLGTYYREFTLDGIGPYLHMNNKTHEHKMCKLFRNFLEYNKVYEFEVDIYDKVKPSFFELQAFGYDRRAPSQCKLSRSVIEARESVNGKRCEPIFFLWIDPVSGEESRLTHKQMRPLVLRIFEQLVFANKAFKALKIKLLSGYNVRLCGTELPRTTNTNLSEIKLTVAQMHMHMQLMEPNISFETALAIMLLSDDRKRYPWNA